MLPGWQESRGVAWETDVAEERGMPTARIAPAEVGVDFDAILAEVRANYSEPPKSCPGSGQATLDNSSSAESILAEAGSWRRS
jgi:hypothetical protein